MPKTKTKRPRAVGLTLHPFTFEQAVRHVLNTPLPPGECRKKRRTTA